MSVVDKSETLREIEAKRREIIKPVTTTAITIEADILMAGNLALQEEDEEYES